MAREELEDRIGRVTERKGVGVKTYDPPPRASHVYQAAPTPGRSPTQGLAGILTMTLCLVVMFSVLSAFLGEDDVMASALPEITTHSALATQESTPAWELLPEAPRGWVALSPADARSDASDAIEVLGTKWPGGADALRALAVFPALAIYLEDAGAIRTSQHMGSAMYVHPSGQYIRADIEVLGFNASFGTELSPREWLQKIPPYLAERDRIAGKFMAFEVGPYVVLCQHVGDPGPEPDLRPTGVMDAMVRWSLLNGDTRSLGSPRLDVPFSPGSTQWGAIDLTVPLDSNVVLTLRGVTSPWMIEEWLKVLDQGRITTRGAEERALTAPRGALPTSYRLAL